MAPTQPRTAPEPVFHHIGIQTTDLDNSVQWYRDFFCCRPSWSLTDFSQLTRSRLPGITRLTELVVADVRLHVFERPGSPAARSIDDASVQFQHVCMSTGSPQELVAWRERWLELFGSDRYTFAYPDPPSEIVTDDQGTQSFYALDVNGLEFEFTYEPSDGQQ